MKRFAAVVLGLLLAVILAASMAYGKANREAEMTRTMRGIIAQTQDPRQVAQLLNQQGARFVGYRQNTVSFVYTGEAVVPMRSTAEVIGPDFKPTVTEKALASDIKPMAGEKADLTVTMWLYEWRNNDGSYTEQAYINGRWSATEYRWLDDPKDVIDVRWIVGDLVYLSSTPYDGVQRDQHTQGIASYTVDDQVQDWDLFVNFRPTSPNVYGRWTNIFVNYTHTWWGVKLGVTLTGGPTGSTGSIAINTDAKTWTEGTGLAFQIGSGETRGPAITALPVEQR
ncbi:MAG TPA: hypothetical protein VNT26_17265 [Candidatus Sulfotelmatobacter sp.]|nr:hypothetical protein [Candidatus Sulfotelmatobacter sp.]